MTPRTLLRSVLRQKAVFGIGGSSEFIQVPEPSRKLGISPNPSANIEGERSEFFYVPEHRRKFGIFSNPITYVEEERSKFFEVPEPIWRRQ